MDYVLLAIGVLAIAVAVIVVVVARLRSHDEVFEGLTPGLLPQAGNQAPRRRLKSREYNGSVAVQFSPPKDAAPGLVGTIVDGKAEMRDVTATIVDLAVRGFLKITPIEAEDGEGAVKSRESKQKSKQDWVLTANAEPPAEPRPFERQLLVAMFGQGPVVRMSDLQSGFGQAMREAQVDLYRQVVDNRWFPRHPLSRSGRYKTIGSVLIVIGIIAAFVLALGTGKVMGFAAGGGLLVAGLILVIGSRGIRVGRTAEGSAMLVQSLGFKKYLATAEADQIKFEEASDIFSRYLPYAIVFGVADHWAKVFGDIAKKYREGVDIGAYNAGDFMLDLMWFDFLSGGGIGEGFGALGEGLASLDLPDFGDPGELFSGIADNVGSFVDSGAGFQMPDLGGCDALDGFDGCDALDGCDGCDL